MRPEKCDKHTRNPQTYHNINLKTPLADPTIRWQENRRWGCLDLGLRLRIRPLGLGLYIGLGLELQLFVLLILLCFLSFVYLLVFEFYE